MSLPREKWRPSVASLAPCLFPPPSQGQGQLRSRHRLLFLYVTSISDVPLLQQTKGREVVGVRWEVELVLPGAHAL